MSISDPCRSLVCHVALRFRYALTRSSTAHNHSTSTMSPDPKSRWGDVGHRRGPTWNFAPGPMNSDARPPCGTSVTYQGREVESQNDNKISKISPGPMS